MLRGVGFGKGKSGGDIAHISLAQAGKIDYSARFLQASHFAWLLPTVLIFAPTINWLVDRWTLSVWQSTHGIFVPFMVAYLVYDALQADFHNKEEASAWGFLFLVPGLALVIVDTAIKTQLLSAIGLTICLPGFSLLLLGTRRTKLLAIPWLLAPLMLPIPAIFKQPIILMLRQISAIGAAEFLTLLGVPVLREQTRLFLADQSVSIADACSGFATLYGTITFALFFAYLAPSRKRRLLVLALAVPIAIACNIVRCAALALMVQTWGMRLLTTYLHPLSGMVSFALAIMLLVTIADALRFRERAA